MAYQLDNCKVLDFTNSSIFVSVSTLGDRIRERREAIGLSQADLGTEVGLSAQSILNYEKGGRDPKSTELANIAKELGTTVAFLMGEIDDPSPTALKSRSLITDDELKTRRTYDPDDEEFDEDLLKHKLDTIIALERAKKARIERQMRESDDRKKGK